MIGQVSKSSSTLPGSVTLPELKSTSGDNDSTALAAAATTTVAASAHHNPDGVVAELIERLPSVAPASMKMGMTTETVKRTTYTETTVKRVTNNQPKAIVEVESIVF